MTDKADLLALLREGTTYISGQELSEHFGVSRTAIWKAIRTLKEDGYEIEAVPNKGYRLVSTPDIMSYSEISSRLGTGYVARELYYYDKVDSTNVRVRQIADTASDGTLVVSDMQEAGRGRRGRGWNSPAGTGIYMSLLLKPDIMPSDAPMITLIMALAVAGAIRNTTGLDARIKWPNDVVINGRKTCGILTEMDMESDYIRDVIVGVGINVNQPDTGSFPEEIRGTATSLKIEAGETVRRSALVAEVMNLFEGYYDSFLGNGDLSGLRQEYEKLLVSIGTEVRVLDPGGEYSGISGGIDDRGELLVKMPDGEVRTVYAGEVSVRGIYGYV
ncbi:MAG: biotin--[Lachnospiraceae bacterium]|nr:biotin--[acetyl-CoA-carboxylase] ligase [Lachnospiraceae bacterium]